MATTTTTATATATVTVTAITTYNRQLINMIYTHITPVLGDFF